MGPSYTPSPSKMPIISTSIRQHYAIVLLWKKTDTLVEFIYIVAIA